MNFNLMMENWRKFVSEQTAEEENERASIAQDEDYASYPEDAKQETESIFSYLGSFLKDLDSAIKRVRPIKHSVVYHDASDWQGNKGGVIINAEHMGNDEKWRFGMNDDAPGRTDTHWGTTELITCIRNAIDHVHKTPNEVYSQRLAKMIAGEIDSEITEENKEMAIIYEDLGWIPKKTNTLYLEDFSVKPYFTDDFGNTYHGNPKVGKGKIRGHGSHQTGRDADTAFYMLQGFEMIKKFTPNRAVGNTVRQYDNANVASGSEPFKAEKSRKQVLRFGAMAPKNTRKPGGLNSSRKPRGSALKPNRKALQAVVKKIKARYAEVDEQGLTIRDKPDDGSHLLWRGKPIQDLDSKDVLSVIKLYHEATAGYDQEILSEEEIFNAKMILSTLTSLGAEKNVYSFKKDGKKTHSSGNFVTRSIGSIDSERTWQLLKGMLDNGATMIFIDEHLLAVLKGAAQRAGDVWSSKIQHVANHRNHIHVRVDATKSYALGKRLGIKIKRILVAGSEIPKKIKNLHKKHPEATEGLFKKRKEASEIDVENELLRVAGHVKALGGDVSDAFSKIEKGIKYGLGFEDTKGVYRDNQEGGDN
jgi:hypothetical protein